MKRIAFPTDDGETISCHMGQAQFFLVAILDDSGNVHFEKRDKPHHNAETGIHQHQHNGHGVGRDMFTSIADCQVLISGGMGESAYRHAQRQGLEVFLPAEKNIQKALEVYRAGNLETDSRRIHTH
jgi:predicted Fe-Mo cluster-binding NifX family protein